MSDDGELPKEEVERRALEIARRVLRTKKPVSASSRCERINPSKNITPERQAGNHQKHR